VLQRGEEESSHIFQLRAQKVRTGVVAAEETSREYGLNVPRKWDGGEKGFQYQKGLNGVGGPRKEENEDWDFQPWGKTKMARLGLW